MSFKSVGVNMIALLGFNNDKSYNEKKDEGGKTGLCHFKVFKTKFKKGKRSLMTIIAVWLVAMFGVI